AENAAEGNVADIEIAVAAEGWTLDEALNFRALAVGVGPCAAALLAELAGQRGEDFGLDFFERLEGIEHKFRGWWVVDSGWSLNGCESIHDSRFTLHPAWVIP